MANLEKMGVFALKDAPRIYLYDNSTNKLAVFIKYANDIQFSVNSEPVYARGAGNSKLVAFSGESEGSITVNMETTSLDILSAQTGSNFQTGVSSNVDKYVSGVAKEADEVVAISGTPVNDEVSVYIVGDDGATILSELSTASYSAGSVTLTGITLGQNYLITYQVEETVNQMSIAGNKLFDTSYRMVVIGKGKTVATGALKPLMIEVPKVTINSSFSLQLSATDVSAFEMTLDIGASATEEMTMITIKEIETV